MSRQLHAATGATERLVPGCDGTGETFPVSIEVRPLLISGLIARQKDRQHAYMMLDSEQSDREFTVSLWHETVHLLMLASGIPASEHDEEVVELLAQKLADSCPEIVSICTLRSPSAPTEKAG